MRALLFAALVTSCSSDGAAPPVMMQVVLADGRTCADAGVTSILVAAQRFACTDAIAPSAVTVTDLPLSSSVDVLGESSEDVVLYRGSVRGGDAVGLDGPLVVTLDANAAR